MVLSSVLSWVLFLFGGRCWWLLLVKVMVFIVLFWCRVM